MNLVVGATGVLGTEICRLLAAENQPVRGLIRKSASEEKREALRKTDVQFAEGDLRDRTSLAAACKNVTNIISTATSIVSRQEGDSFENSDRDGHIQLIEEAEKAKVRSFVFISFPAKDLDNPLQSAKKAVEERLKQSSLQFTILQPTLFQEVWLSPRLGFDFVNSKARIYGEGKNKISWISFFDVAKFAVAALESPYAENKVLPLGGPEALSPLEVVQTFEEVKNRKMDVEFVPESALKAQYDAAQNEIQKTFAGLMLAYTEGTEIPMKDLLEKIPMRLQSVKEYLEKVG